MLSYTIHRLYKLKFIPEVANEGRGDELKDGCVWGGGWGEGSGGGGNIMPFLLRWLWPGKGHKSPKGLLNLDADKRLKLTSNHSRVFFSQNSKSDKNIFWANHDFRWGSWRFPLRPAHGTLIPSTYLYLLACE